MADASGPVSSSPESKLDADPPVDTPPVKSDPKAPVSVSDPVPKKSVCSKHATKDQDPNRSKKKKSHRKAASIVTPSDDSSSELNSSSEESSAESTSDDEDAQSASESDAESDRKQRRRRAKNKIKKSLKSVSRKKKSRSHQTESEPDSDLEDSSDSDSSLDEKTLKKLVAKLKAKKTKKSRSKDDSSEEQQDDDDDADEDADADELALLLAKQKLASLRVKLADGRRKGRGRRGSGDGNTDGQKGGSQKSKGRKKAASKIAFKRVDQLWDNTIHNFKLTETVDDPDANEWDQYLFTVRRKFDWDNKYLETVVDLKSKYLRDALSKVMDGVKGVSLVQETAVVDPNMLFLYLEETRQYMKDLRQLAKTEKKKKARKLAEIKASHLKVLIKYLDTDYAETKKTLYPLLDSSMITFDLLWAIFKPNTVAYSSTYGNQDEPRAFKIEYATKESSFMKGQWYSIEGRYLEYDGKAFGMGTMAAEVESFKGARKITSLSCYPLKYHREAESVKAKLIERGKKFVALRGMNYRYHKGMAFYKKKRSVIKVNINGRVMVDPAIHRRINPNYPISTVRPKDPDYLDGSDDDGSNNGCCCILSDSESEQTYGQPRESDTPQLLFKVVRDKEGKPHVVEVELDENGNEIVKENMDEVADPSDREFTEEELLIASPVVLGFAFSEKLWLEFSISGISEIEWNEDAFDSLVLPDNQKSIVKALVESHTFRAAQNIDDVIQGKGKGLVAVLHGPPGTGKTLTAEGIAELLKRPLYMVSAGELGTDPRTLEAELNKILDIAHSWGAVLLLDEADIFLEKRTIQDIHRNALVSIFLRLLEYFQGILFLTTNRVETFDDAFQSRIHVALRYGELTTKAKRSVWKMFLERVQAKEGVETATFTEKDFDLLARHNLNGRQIKNSVRTAQALAVNEQTPLSMEHIRRVLEVAETFDRDLRGGSGYLDAMRSYT
ncbi:ATP-binding protein [Aspergillus vadensis CBS 113365]|uniref:AAA family ATPase n=1 Tax=Aspergillus vadensis (strain CBS 113365 / IMI 142717 / IBT 24658) TaxID=1448311 RepID=A0A319B3I9_ASPVC|nr:AAA family ATPase [Aspergillus vadensis CBS 113365]PYH67336.1 AAA family ATPase [Aspergillus vadensis CBS 113365]